MKDNDVKFEQSNGNLQTKVSSGEYAAPGFLETKSSSMSVTRSWDSEV